LKPPRRLLAALALGTGLFGGPASAQPTDDQVKAAFLPKFARYVAWPASAQPAADAPFTLCMIGRDPFGRALDGAAAGEVIDGHSVAVRRMASAEGAAGCHMAFVQGANPAETSRMLAALRRQAVLTVTDGGAGTRGMIHFTIVARRVRFFIDEAQAAERGLSISSRLLALAANVRPRR